MPPPPRNASASNLNRLSIIAEDGGPSEALPTTRPPKASHRPFNRRWHDDPPRHSFEASPPEYALGEVGSSKAEALRRLRSNRQVARRGGWRRLVLALAIVTIILIALRVGMGVGLTRKQHDG